MGSAPAPVYTAAVTTTPSATHTTAPSFTPPTAATQGPSYGGMEGDSDDNQLNGAPTGHPAPPRYYKLEFPTFDGGVDPLNWLNQCEPFFCGQRTLASDRTWLASYHLRGAAQTWYYALEQDEGMPSWERFRSLCQLRFGPPTQGTRLAELARLPFLSSVQDYSDRFNSVLCHASNLNSLQKAELFVGGLPEHLKADVEMRSPQDLQSALYYARAYERRAIALDTTPAKRGYRPPVGRSTPPATPRQQPAASSGGVSTPVQPIAPAPSRFRRLSPAEQQERRRQGLCFNCDEPYVRGHVCQHLFYLVNDDYVDDDVPAEATVAAMFQEERTPAPTSLDSTCDAPPAGDPPTVSLNALAGVRTENSMLLPVTVRGQRLVAILDSGSTTNFIHADLFSRLGLNTTPHPSLRVLVANGDRVPCHRLGGVHRHVLRHHLGRIRPHPGRRVPPGARAHPMGLRGSLHDLHTPRPPHLVARARRSARRHSGAQHSRRRRLARAAPPQPHAPSVRRGLRRAARAAASAPV